MDSASLTLHRPTGQRCCLDDLEPAFDADGARSLTDDMAVLAHPVRLQLLGVLTAASEPVCVCDLEASVPVKQPTVSHHLRLLRAAGLVESEKRGLWAYYHVRRDELDRLRRRVSAGLGRLGGDHE